MIQKYMIPEFFHEKGQHCESSSLRDMFEFYGFPISEAMAFGLDGTMGFGFLDFLDISDGDNSPNYPIFIGGKQDTITPKSLACRILGINLEKQAFTSTDKAWEESKSLLLQNTPLMLQVDLAYLGYMQEDIEIKEFHFGGHIITLKGYDESKSIAYVGDSDFEGFQEVSIGQLKNARSSEHGPNFMQPHNVHYWMTPRPDGKRPPFNAGLKLAIQKVVNHMLRPSMSSNGLQGLQNFSESILEWKEKLSKTIKKPFYDEEISLARITFDFIYGEIEEWGTGGACFRNLYKLFLEELVNNQNLKEDPHGWDASEINILQESLPLIEQSAMEWTEFANCLKLAADKYKDECLNKVNLYELSKKVKKIHKVEEELFTNLLKIKI